MTRPLSPRILTVATQQVLDSYSCRTLPSAQLSSVGVTLLLYCTYVAAQSSIQNINALPCFACIVCHHHHHHHHHHHNMKYVER